MAPSTEVRENREFAFEVKFLVPRALAKEIRHWARACLSPDPHASADLTDGYDIASVYFDTEQFDVFHRNGSFGRSKYRIRRYGQSEIAFLERKLKTRGLVTKRRSAIGLDELTLLTQPEAEPAWIGRWFFQRLRARRLTPVCQIRYRRTARVTASDSGPIRLTLDDDIHAIPARGLYFNCDPAGALLLNGEVILEMKYRVEMPLVFKRLVETFAVNPQPISKYRMAMVALGLVKEPVPMEAAPASANGQIHGQLLPSSRPAHESNSSLPSSSDFPKVQQSDKKFAQPG